MLVSYIITLIIKHARIIVDYFATPDCWFIAWWHSRPRSQIHYDCTSPSRDWFPIFTIASWQSLMTKAAPSLLHKRCYTLMLAIGHYRYHHPGYYHMTVIIITIHCCWLQSSYFHWLPLLSTSPGSRPATPPHTRFASAWTWSPT